MRVKPQPSLFDDSQDAAPSAALDESELEAIDLHGQERAIARELMREFVIDEDEAFRVAVFFVSLERARKHLDQRWWRHEIEYRESPDDATAASA